MDIGDPQRAINRTATIVACSMMIMLASTIYALVRVDVPASNQNALLVLIGALSTNVTAVVAFFFGSSSGQKAKDATINTLATTASAQASTISPAPVVPLGPNESVTVKADNK